MSIMNKKTYIVPSLKSIALCVTLGRCLCASVSMDNGQTVSNEYFDNDDSIISRERQISLSFLGKTIYFVTDNGVFSKSKFFSFS